MQEFKKSKKEEEKTTEESVQKEKTQATSRESFDKKKIKLSKNQIIGIIAGSVLLVIVLIAGLFFGFNREARENLIPPSKETLELEEKENNENLPIEEFKKLELDAKATNLVLDLEAAFEDLEPELDYNREDISNEALGIQE
jgi:uncharacterized protein HemX